MSDLQKALNALDNAVQQIIWAYEDPRPEFARSFTVEAIQDYDETMDNLKHMVNELEGDEDE